MNTIQKIYKKIYWNLCIKSFIKEQKQLTKLVKESGELDMLTDHLIDCLTICYMYTSLPKNLVDSTRYKQCKVELIVMQHYLSHANYRELDYKTWLNSYQGREAVRRLVIHASM